MAPRAHWKGYLKLSLVSCPIALYPAISAAERISFRQVNRQTGNRLKQQLVDTITGDVVQSSDKGRGYEVGQNQFLMVEQEELASAEQEARARPYAAVGAVRPVSPEVEVAPEEPRGRRASTLRNNISDAQTDPVVPTDPSHVRVENNRTIDIERFVPRAQIDPRYLDTPYYVAPREQVGVEAFAVIRDAMRDKELVGMGRIILSKRERPIIVEPLGNGLRAMTLRYAHEVRSEVEYFANIPEVRLPEEMLAVAEHILKVKTADFDCAFLEDRYRSVLVEMLRGKQAELPEQRLGQPLSDNVVNLMDALKRSLASEAPSNQSDIRKPTPRRPTQAAKRNRRSGSRTRSA